MIDTSEPLDFAERWLIDGLRVLRPAFAAYQITIDMTAAMQTLEALRRRGVQATSTHLLVQAAAHGLAANSDLHQLIAGTRRQRPARVEIGLSVAGETFIAPVLVVADAHRRSVDDIAAEITKRMPEVRLADRQMLSSLRRWGWLVPFASIRRVILRGLFSSPVFRRKGAGTFQVSTVPVDWALTSTFATSGVLVGGQVWSRVVAVDGLPAVRPTMTVTLSGDHAVWDGRAAARFLSAVRRRLEAG